MPLSNPECYKVGLINSKLRELFRQSIFFTQLVSLSCFFLWLWRPSFTFAHEMSDFTVQFKRRAVEASWQTHFVVFIYVKPVNCMRKLFPQRAPILLVGAPTTSEELFTNPDIPPSGKKEKRSLGSNKKNFWWKMFHYKIKDHIFLDVI